MYPRSSPLKYDLIVYIKAEICNECRHFHVPCILQHKEYHDGNMENKSRYYKTNLHICPNRC